MRIHRKTIALLAFALILCLVLTACGSAKDTPPAPNIPLNVSYGDGPMGVLSQGSEVPEVQKAFQYVVPETPEGFEVDQKDEQPLGLFIAFVGPDDEFIVYSQTFAKDGYAEISVPDGGTATFSEETLDGRNAVIIEYGDEFYILVEDGTSVFEVKGICDRELLYEMAKEVIA